MASTKDVWPRLRRHTSGLLLRPGSQTNNETLESLLFIDFAHQAEDAPTAEMETETGHTLTIANWEVPAAIRWPDLVAVRPPPLLLDDAEPSPVSPGSQPAAQHRRCGGR